MKEKQRFEGWIPNIKECIYSKRWGAKWWLRICCSHVWKHLVTQKVDCLTIEKSICVECGREEILILINWNWKAKEAK